MDRLRACDLVRFATYVADEVSNVYLFSGMGEPITRELVDDRAAMYPDYYTPEVRSSLMRHVDTGVRGFDCSGLIKCFLMGGLENFSHDSAIDWNSRRMYERATETGPLETLPEESGILLHMDGHVGIYLTDGQVVEATPAFREGGGVQRTTISAQRWQSWYRHCLIDYAQDMGEGERSHER